MKFLAVAYLASFSLSTARVAAQASDECADLQTRILDLYDAPSCAYARAVTEQKNALGPAPTVPGLYEEICGGANNGWQINGLTCVSDVADVLEGYIDQGCSIPEKIRPISSFLYNIGYARADFAEATQFYCSITPQSSGSEVDCYRIVKDAPRRCGADGSFGSANFQAECYKPVPCSCLNNFVTSFGSSESADFREDFVKLFENQIEAARKAMAEGVCIMDSPGKTPPPVGFRPPAPAPAPGKVFCLDDPDTYCDCNSDCFENPTFCSCPEAEAATCCNKKVVLPPAPAPVPGVPPPASGPCAGWCNQWTCSSPQCFGCPRCAAERDGCANWCNPYTCSSPQCRSCATCIGGGNRQCESWCNQWSFRSPSCFGCSSSFTAEEVGEDPADKPAYCDHVPENVTQFMLECSADETMEDGSGILCNFLPDGAKGCLEVCGGALDGPDCALPEPEVWCGNLPEVAIPYIDMCKDVTMATPPAESDATEVTEEPEADEEAPTEDTTSASGLVGTSSIPLAMAFGAIGIISFYF